MEKASHPRSRFPAPVSPRTTSHGCVLVVLRPSRRAPRATSPPDHVLLVLPGGQRLFHVAVGSRARVGSPSAEHPEWVEDAGVVDGERAGCYVRWVAVAKVVFATRRERALAVGRNKLALAGGINRCRGEEPAVFEPLNASL